MTRPARAALKIEVLVVSDRWKDSIDAKSIVRRAVSQAASVKLLGTKSLSSKSLTPARELAIVLTDDSAIRLLNRDWRGIDAATNVLSFPTNHADGKYSGNHLGDIVLGFETIAREARAERKPFAHHVAHLAVHGFLHLLGYDHEREEDAVTMECAEREILRQLAIPDPYPPSGEPGKKSNKKPGVEATKASAKKPAKLLVKRAAATKRTTTERTTTERAAKRPGSRSRKS